jgi:hypothetical protein
VIHAIPYDSVLASSAARGSKEAGHPHNHNYSGPFYERPVDYSRPLTGSSSTEWLGYCSVLANKGAPDPHPYTHYEQPRDTSQPPSMQAFALPYDSILASENSAAYARKPASGTYEVPFDDAGLSGQAQTLMFRNPLFAGRSAYEAPINAPAGPALTRAAHIMALPNAYEVPVTEHASAHASVSESGAPTLTTNAVYELGKAAACPSTTEYSPLTYPQ